MKADELFDAIGDIDLDKLPAKTPASMHRRKTAVAAACLAMCALLTTVVAPLWATMPPATTETTVSTAAVVLTTMAPSSPSRPATTVTDVDVTYPSTSPSIAPDKEAYAVAVPQYPVMPTNSCVDTGDWHFESRDAWLDCVHALTADYEARNPDIHAFVQKTAAQWIGGEENRVYSPLNVYLALGMLAETCDGDARKQLLGVLGVDDMDMLRGYANALWEANYRDDGAVTSVLGSSLWMHEDIDFNADTIETLRNEYYAATFQGVLGTPALNAALRDWLNEQTGGVLKNAVDGVEIPPDAVLALATTIYFSARWNEEFSQTEDDVFHGTARDVTCSFMKQTIRSEYYQGDGFSAVSKAFEGAFGGMWLIRPDNGNTPEDILSAALDFVNMPSGCSSVTADIRLSLPRFDVSSSIDLRDGLKALGVTDVFDGSADFSPLTEDVAVAVEEAIHAAGVRVDEEGCEAAAFTVMLECGSAQPQEYPQIDFELDDPFLFVITSRVGTPLFIGVVNQMH